MGAPRTSVRFPGQLPGELADQIERGLPYVVLP
jgi:hypothetical protein